MGIKSINLGYTYWEWGENNDYWAWKITFSINYLVIQDILLNLFGLPNFCLNNLQFKKDASKFFKIEFPELDNDEIFDFINFLYPNVEGTFENIATSKNNTFQFLWYSI